MTTDNSDLEAERAQLLGEIARLKISRETGVPTGLLANGSTADECRALAVEALRWRGAGEPAAPTSAVPAYTVGQYAQRNLSHMTASQIIAADAQGRLEALGGQPSPDRRNGATH
jgi:hypothetical protein